LPVSKPFMTASTLVQVYLLSQFPYLRQSEK
jgi:hypothetical protein